MGKKIQGAALRAKKRAREAVEAMQERQAEAAESLAHQPDEALFVVDKTGKETLSQPKRQKKELSKAQNKKSDEEQVQKLMERHNNDAEKLAQLAAQSKFDASQKCLSRRSLKGSTQANFDLWDSNGSEAVTGTSKSKTTTNGVAVDVAKSGQSYCPDPTAHRKVVENAIHVEKARNAAVEYRDTPQQFMSEETRALLIYDSDTDDDEDEVDDGKGTMAVGKIPKRTDKKTKAQRNKEKRLRREHAELQSRREKKKLLGQVGEIGRYRKEIKRHEKQRQELKSKIEQTKAAEKPKGADLHEKLSKEDPIRAPTLPVALPSEVSGGVSLRSLKPKGNLAAERQVSLYDRNLAPKPTNNTVHCRGKKRKKSLKGARNKVGVDGYMIDIKG
jgi:nucleolar protein 53